MHRLKERGRYWSDRALDAARTAVQLDRNLPAAHFSLGSIYTAIGRIQDYIAEKKWGLQLAPNSHVGYSRLGAGYQAAGQKDEAIQAFEKALEIAPYDWGNYYWAGQAYFEFGDYRKALVPMFEDSVQNGQKIGLRRRAEGELGNEHQFFELQRGGDDFFAQGVR
jgi:tetratricopeptide (TPR) repeat protein